MEKLDVNNFEKFLVTNSMVAVLFVSDSVVQCKQLVELTEDLVKQDEFSKVKFVTFDIAASETASLLAQQFAVASVPTTLIFNLGNEVDRMVGADPGKLVAKVRNLTENYTRLEERLEKLINTAPIMIFIKGSPSQPRCGFSRTLVTLLQEYKINFEHFDILTDEEVRQGLKLRSKWPTYPQVYVKGELIGGLDIIQELHENKELADVLNVQG